MRPLRLGDCAVGLEPIERYLRLGILKVRAGLHHPRILLLLLVCPPRRFSHRVARFRHLGKTRITKSFAPPRQKLLVAASGAWLRQTHGELVGHSPHRPAPPPKAPPQGLNSGKVNS